MSATPTGSGRRIAESDTGGRRFGPLVVAGLVAILVTMGALALQAPAAEQIPPPPEAPARTPLTVADLACPSADSSSVTIGSDSQQDGEGSVGVSTGGSDPEPVELSAGEATRARASGDPVVVRGEGALAPGLFASRYAGAGRAAGECPAPTGSTWFVGVGSSGVHDSRLQLTNPDAGPAVADLSLWSTDGPMEEVRSRGLTVPGGDTTTIDLSDLAPHPRELAMQVTVSRGRVAASVLDGYAIPGQKPTEDWLTASAEPATKLAVPGLSKEADERTLVLANPGDTGGRVKLRVTGKQSTFAPAGLEPIEVPAGQVVVTDLTDQLAGALNGEDTALELTSTVPVTGTLRDVVDSDLVQLPAVAPASGRTATTAPEKGERTLMLTTGAEKGGAFEVTFVGATKGGDWRGRLKPGTTTVVEVPDGTIAVLADGPAPYVGGVRTRSGDGSSFLPLRTLTYDRILPKVAPALPDE
ncbi:hypothetical protein EKO23_18230 [Nocardioides guangzhouensis]|uniref:Secreted protein n=1 Tax=Nocardioides guangzhouensis TaxID=2497878 RepID=A0A4Q4Z8C8_9ACTN|nr:DUF5719 family protein [Nocardioides guangzhouensis]RYP83695.1 hypothetical protein EKO23_18230 [Nocardioides guangzhouensis]